MDPDKALQDIRDAISGLDDVDSSGDRRGDWLAAIDELVMGVQALDTWLSNGGFLPLAWQNFGGLKSPTNPEHVITIEGPIAYPGGKDGAFRAHCSAGDYASDFEFSEQEARSDGDAHVRGVTP